MAARPALATDAIQEFKNVTPREKGILTAY